MRAHRSVIALVALAVILLGATVLAFALTPRRKTQEVTDAIAVRDQFVVECTWSHRAPDDPIVHPGHAGAAHLHDFFGSTETDASSTAVSLLGTPSTCQTSADTAAYWAPTLFDADQPVAPGRLFAYYRRPPVTNAGDVVAFPLGLVMLAGDAQATGSQPLDVVAWHCGGSSKLSSEPVTCPRTAPLTLRVAFPACWDGQSLDSDDHRSHTTYPDDGRCDRDHPVVLPELVVDVSYTFWGTPDDLRLASGTTHTAHADFLNAWDPEHLTELVDTCLRNGQRCGVPPSRTSD